MESKFKGTPGPWRWELNKKSKNLQLCGHGECGPFDYTVMDFERWGMHSAVPRFREGDMDTMVKAFEFAQVVQGREHHKQWFQKINHPDALLIAAAPQLLEALQYMVDVFENNNGSNVNQQEAIADAKQAINAALGIKGEE